MNKTVYYIASALLLVTVITNEGCYYDNAEDLYPVDTVLVPIDTNSTQVSWMGRVEPIIESNCATSGGCHAANSGTRQPLTTYDEVKSAIENWDLKNRVESGSMPPTGTLPATEKKAIIDWINDDYPNN
ncbi:MAG: hypothetical protein WEC59_04695 [Salibacteraceae bacterium]